LSDTKTVSIEAARQAVKDVANYYERAGYGLHADRMMLLNCLAEALPHVPQELAQKILDKITLSRKPKVEGA